MSTGMNLKDVGPYGSWGNALSPQTSRVGKTYVRGYPSTKFHLPEHLLVTIQQPQPEDESEYEKTVGEVAAFLMRLGTQLATSWVNQVNVMRSSTKNQKRSV